MTFVTTFAVTWYLTCVSRRTSICSSSSESMVFVPCPKRSITFCFVHLSVVKPQSLNAFTVNGFDNGTAAETGGGKDPGVRGLDRIVFTVAGKKMKSNIMYP